MSDMYSPGLMTGQRSELEATLQRRATGALTTMLDEVREQALTGEFTRAGLDQGWEEFTRQMVSAVGGEVDDRAQVMKVLRPSGLPDQIYDSVQATLRESREKDWTSGELRDELAAVLDITQASTRQEPEDLTASLGRFGSRWISVLVGATRLISTAISSRRVMRMLNWAGVRQVMWVAYQDERTRPTHREADGQIQPIGTPFRVGATMLEHPGDNAGPAEEIMNCRCVVVGVRVV